MESDTQVYKYKGKSLDKAGGQMNKVSRKDIGTNIVGRRPYLYLQKAQRRSTKKMVLPKGIDSLWCLSLDSQHIMPSTGQKIVMGTFFTARHLCFT